MKLYSIKTNNGDVYFDLDKIETFYDLPVMNEGDAVLVSVIMASGASHTVDKMSLYSAFVHAEVKVMGQE
ncbi:MAG: hypothetical protein ACRDCE_17955 [Cetobacterium sp.]|uniref:hypothetical protein n=1 Tax=Cetobacterium sp. TaxID=2071632 RepID=UPI003EE5EF52